MKKALSTFFGIVLSAISLVANAEQCDAHFADGKSPQATVKELNAKSTFLCYEGFAVLHSGITRGPLWSAEHLTRASLQSASQLKRVNSFHAEDRLPPGYRSELSDFSRSGYDRGHLSNSADAATQRAQQETFTLANMVPQDPDNNRGIFEGIESTVRTLAKNRGELFVVTGPIFDGILEGGPFKRMNGRVAIPTRIFKAVYDPARHEAAVYVVNNAPGMQYKVISVAELEKQIGFNVFPGMSWPVKQVAASVPEPTPHGYNKQAKSGTSKSHEHAGSSRELETLVRMGMRMLR